MKLESPIQADGRWRRNPDVHAREFDGELIILDLQQGEYYALDAVGTQMWKHLVDGRSPAEIASVLQPEYKVEEAMLLKDVLVLLNELRARHLVVRCEGP